MKKVLSPISEKKMREKAARKPLRPKGPLTSISLKVVPWGVAAGTKCNSCLANRIRVDPQAAKLYVLVMRLTTHPLLLLLLLRRSQTLQWNMRSKSYDWSGKAASKHAVERQHKDEPATCRQLRNTHGIAVQYTPTHKRRDREKDAPVSRRMLLSRLQRNKTCTDERKLSNDPKPA